MPLPEHVKQIAAIAGGKRVRVVDAHGAVTILSASDEPAVDPAAQTAARLIELDAQLRATIGIVASVAQHVNELVKRFESALAEVRTAVDAVAAGTDKVAKSADQLEAAFYTPVIPVYDKAGKIIAAQRIKRSD